MDKHKATDKDVIDHLLSHVIDLWHEGKIDTPSVWEALGISEEHYKENLTSGDFNIKSFVEGEINRE